MNTENNNETKPKNNIVKKILIGIAIFTLAIIVWYLQTKHDMEKQTRLAEMDVEKIYIALDWGYQSCLMTLQELPVSKHDEQKKKCRQGVENKKEKVEHRKAWETLQTRLNHAMNNTNIEQCFYRIADNAGKKLVSFKENEALIEQCIANK